MIEMDFDSFKAAAKAELHVHLEGSMRSDRLLAFAAQDREHPWHGMSLEALERLRKTTSFMEFIEIFKAGYRLLRTRSHYQAITEDLLEDLEAQGVTSADILYSPGVAIQMLGVDLAEVHAGIAAGLRQAPKIRTRFVLDTVINLGPAFMRRTLDAVLADAPDFVRGFCVGGGDPAFDMREIADLFAYANKNDLFCIAHAGEVDGPENIRILLDETPVRRIAHGCNAVKDAALLQRMAREGMAVDVCISSNLRTGVVADLSQHPLPAFAAAGVPFTLNTDDPFYFETDLYREYQLAMQLLPQADWRDWARASLAVVG